jgi:hypothetical protein
VYQEGFSSNLPLHSSASRIEELNDQLENMNYYGPISLVILCLAHLIHAVNEKVPVLEGGDKKLKLTSDTLDMWHIPMVLDQPRDEVFQKAIEKHVR